MKSAGVLTSNAREHHALGASLAAMLLVLFAGSIASAQSSAVPTTPKTEAAAVPSNMVPTPLDNIEATAPSTAEITPDNPVDPSQQQASGGTPDPQNPNEGNEVARYQEEQSGMPPEQLKTLQEFDSEGELTTPFGMELREAKRSLKTGEDADGLLITAVAKGSPAASVGLRPYTHNVHDALTAAAMVGAVFSSGLSVVLIPAIDYMQVGESYDMIIGVDGSRVTNFLDFQDRMRDLQPGELVYLSVLRDGKRVQVTMPVPANILQATN
jgi:S1-C subfamily serine protease